MLKDNLTIKRVFLEKFGIDLNVYTDELNFLNLSKRFY